MSLQDLLNAFLIKKLSFSGYQNLNNFFLSFCSGKKKEFPLELFNDSNLFVSSACKSCQNVAKSSSNKKSSPGTNSGNKELYFSH